MEPDDTYCDTSPPQPPVPAAAPGDGPSADCVLCGEPTEYPADTGGAPLCPRCAWQQAQRGACSG
ncbi:hypothetical protein GXW83_11265 [Streptacidiphilus sp. PB12-B1b]|uniref:hypothetical protein n=1 Tax=Streptacidiphilus sp. PB12-B1b TaxID=2705012 RepID=UPI0015FDDDBA|nr:hypothetical protein [Streptacidiphilus sp. PB12-B1b]QMU76236.1 hypothetical protein GXW83_11265 [Streptacidiphilus sp. PB12-B1b]